MNMKMKTGRLKPLSLLCLLLGLAFSSCSSEGGGEKEEEIETGINEVIYNQSLEVFSNPERGLYQHTEVHNAGQGLNLQELELLRNQDITLVLRVFYFEDFKNGPLSEEVLSRIDEDLETIRAAGLKAIVRFAYTNEMEGADAPLPVIEGHLEQLEPLFEEHEDVIAFVQAGFIGPWGEWHNSSNNLTTVENERKILFKLLEVLPTDVKVQVRTPCAKQQIFNTTEPIGSEIAHTAERRARVGHHNDCFLAGETDYGTYTNVEADKAYISQEALYVPTGGETCPPQGETADCATAREEMKLLRWTYLNISYYEPVLNTWRNAGCFEELRRNLGYRLVLQNAKLPSEVEVNTEYEVEINLRNVGNAPLYNLKSTNLVFMNKSSGEAYTVNLPIDLRKAKPGSVFTINEKVSTAGIPTGEYDLYLEITDGSESLQDRIEYNVRLANVDTWNPATGMNSLQHVVEVVETL